MEDFLKQLFNFNVNSHHELARNIDNSAMLAGKQACWAQKQMFNGAIDCLADVEFQVYSQWGDDGIIEWLVSNLDISSETFIEFGVENYKEANTRFLLKNRNWRGLIIDGSEDNIKQVKSGNLYWRYDLSAVPCFITRGNINQIFRMSGFSGPLGILSIDIDGNDYWVMEKIKNVNPDIIICEYNAVFGDMIPITVPYDDNFYRTKAHHSNLYFGASIAALTMLAERKGYSFAGTNSAGNNAFYVRNDIFEKIDGLIKHKKAFPSRFREARDEQGRLTFTRGENRLKMIADMPVVRLDAEETVEIGSIENLYSEQWKAVF